MNIFERLMKAVRKPFISCIVPVYKTELYLSSCVESILAQSFTDFELILVDDGSSDDSGFICDKYARNDRRVRSIHHKNAGVSSARNVGIDCAQGDFLFFVDSDDTIHQLTFEHLVDCQKRYNADIVIGEYQKINTLISDTRIRRKLGHVISADEFMNSGFIRRIATGRLIRKDILGDIRFDKRVKVGEDTIFNYSILIKKRQLVIAICEEILYNWFVHPDSASNLDKGDGLYNVGSWCADSYLRMDRQSQEGDQLSRLLLLESAKELLLSRYVCNKYKRDNSRCDKKIKEVSRLLWNDKGCSIKEKYLYYILLKSPLSYALFKRWRDR